MVAYVYILASKRNGTLYTGATTDLANRILAHKTGSVQGFTKKYNVNQLVYVEEHASIEDALRRERAIKEWKREWKLRLIEGLNPHWKDLAEESLEEGLSHSDFPARSRSSPGGIQLGVRAGSRPPPGSRPELLQSPAFRRST